MTAHVRDLFDLSGRVAIVTGGSRGLGREMAEGLAEAGASLMLCARRDEWLTPTVNELRAEGFKVEGLLCDVTDQAQVQAVVDQTIKTFGQVDILINNAGVSWGASPEEMPFDKWQKVIDINLTGAFLVRAGGRARDVEARVRAHHQRLVRVGLAVVGGRAALRRLCGEQGRAVRLDARTRRDVGAAVAFASTPSRRASFIRALRTPPSSMLSRQSKHAIRLRASALRAS